MPRRTQGGVRGARRRRPRAPGEDPSHRTGRAPRSKSKGTPGLSHREVPIARISHPGTNLPRDLAQGFPLIGDIPISLVASGSAPPSSTSSSLGAHRARASPGQTLSLGASPTSCPPSSGCSREQLAGRASVAVVLENIIMHKDCEVRLNISRLFRVEPQFPNARLWAHCDRDCSY